MMGAAYVMFYGLAFIGGVFLAMVWGKVARHARCATRPGPIDQYCLISIGLCVGAVANVIIFGTRTVSALQYGIDPAITRQPWSILVLAGLATMALSKTVLMFAHDPTHRSASWRWYAVLSALWVIVSPFWILR